MKHFIIKTIALFAGILFACNSYADVNLQELVNSAEAGTTVTLTENVTLTDRVDINKNLIVDLGGYTITTTATCGNGSAFNVVSGTVTIQNGTIDAAFGESNNGETDAITARSGSDVTLKNLNISVKSKNGACVYAFEGGHITIVSGTYKNITTEQYQWNPNFKAMVVNQANVTAKLVTIQGGKFIGQDPSVGDDSAKTNTFLPETLATQKDSEGNFVVVPSVAKIGDKGYATLAEAFAAVTDNTPTTIEVLADCSGNGIIVPSERDITVNFNNHTYTVNTDVLAGSNGTQNQCFQLLRDSKVAFNNGTIVADNAAIKMIIQNYSDLTLTGMTIDATQGTNSVGYVVSNNNGNTVLGTGTTITAKSTGVAFDVYSFKNQFIYTGAKVTVDGATINGNVEVSAKNDGCDVSNLGLVLNSGTITGQIIMGTRATEATVTKSETFDMEAPADYKWNAEGKLVPKVYIVQIGEDKYETLEEAITAAGEAETTIKLLANMEIAAVSAIPANVTIDANGYSFAVTTYTVTDGQPAPRIPASTMTATTATYTRTIGANQWGTICVPFNLKSCDDYTLYNISDITKDKLNLTEAEEVPAGTPVIFKSNSSATSVVFRTTGATVSQTAPRANDQLLGAYTAQTITENLTTTYFINGDKFHQAQLSLTVPGYRAYIKVESPLGMKQLTICLPGEDATAADTVASDVAATPVAFYDMQGNILTAPQRGITLIRLSDGTVRKVGSAK